MFWCYLCISRNDHEVHESMREGSTIGSTVHMSLLDLQKAFDSVEFPVLLDHLFYQWEDLRLIRNWYKDGTCSVQVDGALLNWERRPPGVSPIPNPLQHCDGPSSEITGVFRIGTVHQYGLYGGAYLHADEVRTLSASISSLQAQINLILNFAKRNFLDLNPSKCEIVSFSQNNRIEHPVCEIEGKTLPTHGTAKCLGYHWNHDLSAKPSVEY